MVKPKTSQISTTTRTLGDGTKRTYIYGIDEGGDRVSLGSYDRTESDFLTCYRVSERDRIVAALQANSSVLVVGETGSGKTTLGEFVAQKLQEMGFRVAIIKPIASKQLLTRLADVLGVDTTDLEGRALTMDGLKRSIAAHLLDNTAFLIWDSAHRLEAKFRAWLEDLHAQGQPMLVLATFPPGNDIFIKLPRIELKPLPTKAIRAILQHTAELLQMNLHDGQLSKLQERCGGNPMLATRVVWEEYLGLEDLAPDHTQWIDGTPFLVAALMCLVIVRFIGLGFNSTSLYLIGGMLTVALGVVRILIMSMPRKNTRLGR